MADARQETRWVLRAQAGDREALDALLKAVQEPLYRYIFSLVGQPALAEDILQEVFIRIYRKLGWLREPELFRAWAYRIAIREAVKHLKRERRWTDQVRDEEVLEALPSPPVEMDRAMIEHLPRLIASLSPASRAVVVLHYLHELSLDEVAAALEVPIGTVKSRLAYGLASLRRQFQQPSD